MLDLKYVHVKRSLNLLLRHAVQRTEPQNQIDRVNPNHFSIRKQLRQDIQGYAIVRIVKRRHEHKPVCNVKIRVTRRQPLAGEIYRLRHRKRNHAKSPS